MGFADIFLMVLIISGAVYTLYRSIWKKKGHCSGCDSEMCEMKKKYNSKGF
jgi:hypothetical protein